MQENIPHCPFLMKEYTFVLVESKYRKPLVYLVSVTMQGSKMQWKFSCNSKLITTSALTVPCWEKGESVPLTAS